jgi:hypothetical protein
MRECCALKSNLPAVWGDVERLCKSPETFRSGNRLHIVWIHRSAPAPAKHPWKGGRLARLQVARVMAGSGPMKARRADASAFPNLGFSPVPREHWRCHNPNWR